MIEPIRVGLSPISTEAMSGCSTRVDTISVSSTGIGFARSGAPSTLRAAQLFLCAAATRPNGHGLDPRPEQTRRRFGSREVHDHALMDSQQATRPSRSPKQGRGDDATKTLPPKNESETLLPLSGRWTAGLSTEAAIAASRRPAESGAV